MAIGIFGGTFDPIHFGHISVAKGLLEKGVVSEIWVIPVHQNPHKLDAPPTSSLHRLRMCEIAFEGVRGVKVLDIESKRPDLSFTFNTVKSLYDKEQSRASPRPLRLIMGEDAAHGFHRWKHPFKIIEMALPLVVSRSVFSHPIEDANHPEIAAILEENRVELPTVEISATEIRERIRENRPCGELLPRKVLDYIYENRLY